MGVQKAAATQRDSVDTPGPGGLYRPLGERFDQGTVEHVCAERGIPLPAAGAPDSIVVVDGGGRVLERSDAALAIASALPFPWRMLGVFRIVPRALRDRVYRIVARNRYRWFGRRDACMVPTDEIRSRFLD